MQYTGHQDYSDIAAGMPEADEPTGECAVAAERVGDAQRRWVDCLEAFTSIMGKDCRAVSFESLDNVMDAVEFALQRDLVDEIKLLEDSGFQFETDVYPDDRKKRLESAVSELMGRKMNSLRRLTQENARFLIAPIARELERGGFHVHEVLGG